MSNLTSNRPRLAEAKRQIEAMDSAADEESQLLIDVAAGELFLHGGIGPTEITARAVEAALKTLKRRAVRIYINSPGGSVSEGVAVFNAIKRYEGQVTTVCDGICASMASFILCASGTRLIDANSCVMVHNPWSVAIGDEHDLKRESELLQRFGAMIRGVYAKATGKTHSEIEGLMNAESWYFGSEAIDAGFCTGMIGGSSRPKLTAARRAALRLAGQQALADADHAIAVSLQ